MGGDLNIHGPQVLAHAVMIVLWNLRVKPIYTFLTSSTIDYMWLLEFSSLWWAKKESWTWNIFFFIITSSLALISTQLYFFYRLSYGIVCIALCVFCTRGHITRLIEHCCHVAIIQCGKLEGCCCFAGVLLVHILTPRDSKLTMCGSKC